MSVTVGIVIALAVLEAGWLAYDGLHALRTGHYVTPRAGPYAGRLGPWAVILRAAGIDPHARGVKIAHLALGGVWLLVTAAFAAGIPGSRPGMIVCAVAALWYLPFGTVLSAAQIAILLAAGPA